MESVEAIILHVEIRQKAESSLHSQEIEEKVRNFLDDQNEILCGTVFTDEILPEHIDQVRVCCNAAVQSIKLSQPGVEYRFYVYQVFSLVPRYDALDERDENSPAASLNWVLPNLEFEGLWESLILDDDIKAQLLNYVQTIFLYSQSRVSSNIVKWNGVVLLHGPPGTGKTSLCKALAQKLSIRLSKQFKSGQLIEINSHSLFSKWYSESPKLVFNLFKTIKQWLECEENFVCILIDEVESLTQSRQKVASDPSDSIRVVNTLLTQVDQLRNYRNFVLLATSNVTDAIDAAFADRADLKLFLGYPDQYATYEILRSCIEELIRCELIEGTPNRFFELNVMRELYPLLKNKTPVTDIIENSKTLFDMTLLCKGFSGRNLRKIPFLASTNLIDKPRPNIPQFLKALKNVILYHISENEKYFNDRDDE